MAGAGFSLDGKAFNGMLGKLAAAVMNRQQILADVGEAMVASTRRRFKAESDPQGKKWKPSARAMAEGGQTLTDTARLKNSITYEATGNGVAWGTNVVYGAIHNEGGEITPKSAKALKFEVGGGFVTVKKVKAPRRQFVGISHDDKERIKQAISAHIAPAIKGVVK
jgi:phage virion morphogenesis protein